MSVKVRTGNLVRPWSWVTWQVRTGIRLTRKPLSKASRVNERSWTGRDTEVKERDNADTLLQRKLSEEPVCF